MMKKILIKLKNLKSKNRKSKSNSMFKITLKATFRKSLPGKPGHTALFEYCRFAKLVLRVLLLIFY